MSQKIQMILLMLKGLSLLLTKNLWKKPRLSKSTLPGWDSVLIPILTWESPDAEVVAPAVLAATDSLSVLKERCPKDLGHLSFINNNMRIDNGRTLISGEPVDPVLWDSWPWGVLV